VRYGEKRRGSHGDAERRRGREAHTETRRHGGKGS